MQIILGILVSFAAALVFFLVEPMLLGLNEGWRIFITVLLFFVVVATTYVISPFQPHEAKQARSIGTGNTSKKDLDIELSNVNAKDGSGNIASDNESGGNTKIKISNSDI